MPTDIDRLKRITKANQGLAFGTRPGDRLFRALFAESLDAIVIADDEARYVEANPAACDLFGLNREEMLRRRVPDLAPPSLRDAAERAWKDFRAAGFQKGEFELARPNGTVRTVEYSAKADVVPGRHLSILRDVTKERALHRRVSSEKTRLDAVLNQLPIGVLIADVESRQFVFANRKYEEYLRCSFEPTGFEEYARTVRVTFPDGAGVAPSDYPILRALETGQAVGAEDFVLEAGGERVHVRVSAAPVLDEERRVTAAVAVIEDVTEEKKVLEERSENERTREVFVGALGHDLRNPLSAVLINAEIVRGSLPAGVSAAPLDRIVASANRMSRMISDLLDFTRVRHGTLWLDRATADVRQITSRVVDEFQTIHPGTVHADLSPVTASVDPDRFAQVVSNLVGNAIRHGDGRGVRVRLRQEEGNLELEVHNTGKPIPAGALGSIFDPFRSVSGHAGRESLGLGLFIVRHIVAAHGGDVRVSSDAETGTTFRVRIPARSGEARSPR